MTLHVVNLLDIICVKSSMKNSSRRKFFNCVEYVKKWIIEKDNFKLIWKSNSVIVVQIAHYFQKVISLQNTRLDVTILPHKSGVLHVVLATYSL